MVTWFMTFAHLENI